jgi:hypothetical protein
VNITSDVARRLELWRTISAEMWTMLNQVDCTTLAFMPARKGYNRNLNIAAPQTPA